MSILNGSITHDWRLYVPDGSGGYQHDGTIAVVAWPPETQAAAGARQTVGGIAEDADLVALTDDAAAADVSQGQSTVLQRRADGDETVALVDGRQALPTLDGGIEAWQVGFSAEEGADLSLFPDP